MNSTTRATAVRLAWVGAAVLRGASQCKYYGAPCTVKRIMGAGCRMDEIMALRRLAHPVRPP